MIRDVATVTNVFIIGGDRADLYKVNKVPHGTVRRMWYNSPTLGMDRRLTVYTPAGYENRQASVIPSSTCCMAPEVTKRHGLPWAVLHKSWIT